MKNIMKNIVLWSAAIVLFSCAKTEVVDPNEFNQGEYPVLLQAQVKATKATKALENPAPELNAGITMDIVRRYVTEVTYANETFTNLKYNFLSVEDEVGSLEADGDPVYWKGVKDIIDIYAYAPHVNTTVAGVTTDLTEFTVNEDQSTFEDYDLSDLKYAQIKDVRFSQRANIVLPFKHRLSAIDVILSAGDGVSEAEIEAATVKVLNTKTTVGFNVKTGFLGTISNEKTIQMYKKYIDLVDIYINHAIVVPQTVNRLNDLFEIDINGVQYYANTGKSTDLTFEEGKYYTFNIMIHKERVELKYTVKAWEDATPVDGETTVMDNMDNTADFTSNTFVMKSGKKMTFSVKKAFDMWANNAMLSSEAPNMTGVVTAEVMWQEEPNLIVIEAVSGSGKDAKIRVKTTAGVNGNAVVAVKVGNVIRWSWHIWVTDEDVFATQYPWNNGTTGGDYVFMDRNLGALNATPGDAGSKGLLYQWGRKDPFVGSSEWGVTNGKQYKANGESIYFKVSDIGDKFPMTNTIKLPYDFNIRNYFLEAYSATDKDLWGALTGTKSAFDPCPAGWKVPASKNTKLPWEGLTVPSGNIDDNHGWVFDKIGYYPKAGYRTFTSIKDPGSVQTSSYYWIADNQTLTGNENRTMALSNARLADVDKAIGASIRCVKE